jgi:hypothetical protein
LNLIGAFQQVVFQNEVRPYVSIPFNYTWVSEFQATSLGSDNHGHHMAKGNVVVNVDPEALVVGVRAESKFEISP